jgi:hypothetical protein
MAAEGTGSQLPHARLLFLLLLAPTALWLFGLIVLPHLELGILSVEDIALLGIVVSGMVDILHLAYCIYYNLK